jgi:hypothetical protein
VVQQDETTQQHTERNPEVNVSHNGAEKAVFGRLIIGHPAPSCSHSLLCSTNDGAATSLPRTETLRPGGGKVRRSLSRSFMGISLFTQPAWGK